MALAPDIAFFHAGDEPLRSKSRDHNSHNSGDRLGALDSTGKKNTFGVGLPPAADNGSDQRAGSHHGGVRVQRDG
ncbi:MAG: hypothetical protein KA072_08480 [Thermoanaerobaculaceae bacterium]|nr:hypothetical protein [Thermoanaerobaculaceae bacterium]MDI9620419.1 hypothetical protein [Acidobacteriota bacterium]NLH12356.1 hypothetical protein [Holophagae bacterium]HPW55093.1 hypothetical protein [Thermoanaerobaculaceae bacterium]